VVPGTPRPSNRIAPAPSLSPTPRVHGEAQREKDPVLLAAGVKRFATAPGVSYPVWDFNNVDVSYARTADRDRWLEMFVIVNSNDMKMDPAAWIYGGENNKDWQDARPLPASSCQ